MTDGGVTPTMQPAFRYGGTPPCAYKFTGKERDSESGLDNFGARYNASSRVPHTLAFFANVWALLASVYSRVRIISLGTNGQSGDQMEFACDLDAFRW
jgi:hypothetical protein